MGRLKDVDRQVEVAEDRDSSAIDATHSAPVLSSPMSGRKIAPWSVVKAMSVLIVMPPARRERFGYQAR